MTAADDRKSPQAVGLWWWLAFVSLVLATVLWMVGQVLDPMLLDLWSVAAVTAAFVLEAIDAMVRSGGTTRTEPTHSAELRRRRVSGPRRP